MCGWGGSKTCVAAVTVGVCGWGGSRTCVAGVEVGRVWLGWK